MINYQPILLLFLVWNKRDYVFGEAQFNLVAQGRFTLELSDLAESEQSFPALMQVMTRTIEMTRVVFFYEVLNLFT